MAGLVPAIHVGPPQRPSLRCWRPIGKALGPRPSRTTWMAGTSPAMTENGMESRILPVCFSLCAERHSDGQRLVDRREHLPHREFVEAAPVTVEPPLAIFIPTRSARRGILHEPDTECKARDFARARHECKARDFARARHCLAAGGRPRHPTAHRARRSAKVPIPAGQSARRAQQSHNPSPRQDA